ncbi:MAG: BrnT family toxin [Janthinobacterium lividum]
MKLTYDEPKRAATLANRGLDFLDASLVFEGCTVEIVDDRWDYGETRILCFGHLRDRLVVVGYVQRGAVRHIFSMRKANEREKRALAGKF